MKTMIAVVIGTVFVFAALLAVRLGVFRDVRIVEAEEGPFRQIYLRHTGPYHKIVPILDRVEDWAEENGESCKLTFGEYLDDPKKVDEDRLQSLGGCIVEKDWSGKPLPERFEYREVPRRSYIVALFDGAPSISPYKVYPKVFAYMGERQMKHQGPVIEIYRIVFDNAVETKYLFPTQGLANSP